MTHLDRLPFMKHAPNLRLNESFMVIAGVLLAINIIHRFFYSSSRHVSNQLTLFSLIAISMFDEPPGLKRKVALDLFYSCSHSCFLL